MPTPNTDFQPLSFFKEYRLEDGRVRLSPLQLEHIEPLSEVANHPEVWTYFLETGQGTNQLEAYVKAAIEKRDQGLEYPFVIFDKLKGTYAGITRIYDYSPQLGNIKIGHTWIGKPFWGTGLNGHCKQLLFQFCFATLGVARIGFGVHGENVRSVKALQKLGCQIEGRLRDFLINAQGERVDLLLLSMLREEWNPAG